MDRVRGTTSGGSAERDRLTRRQILQYSGGLAGLLALGPAGFHAAAQDGSSPSQLVNGGGTPPTAPSGELTHALQFDVQNLDSIMTYTLSNAHWESEVYSPLTWRDNNLVLYDGLDGRPTPDEGFGLAQSWEYADDLTLKMTLKTGITFHNGEPFTAASVKAHFERMLNPDVASPQAFNYAAIQSVEVVDDANVIFHFASVDPVMITKFAGYGAFITPAQGSTEANFGTEMTYGTGPFKVVEYVKDDHLTIEAWDGYWGSAKPLVQRINYRIIPDDNTRLAELLAGSVDFLQLNVNQLSAVEGNPDITIAEVGSPQVNGLRLDAGKAPTDNKEVRQAIAHAIDLQTIIDTILSGHAKPVPVWQSPFSFGYDEELQPYTYDPETAKQHLTASGLSTPVKVTFDVLSGDSEAKETADAVKGMLDAVGFDTEIRIQESATYFDDYRFGKLGNIVWFGWGGWTLDYDNTYYSMHYTKQTYNPGYSNPEVDKLLDEERATLDQAKRLDLGHQINQFLYDDAPDVALHQVTALFAVNNRVKNIIIPPDDRFWLTGVWVED